MLNSKYNSTHPVIYKTKYNTSSLTGSYANWKEGYYYLAGWSFCPQSPGEFIEDTTDLYLDYFYKPVGKNKAASYFKKLLLKYLFPIIPDFRAITNRYLLSVTDNRCAHQTWIVENLILFGANIIHILH